VSGVRKEAFQVEEDGKVRTISIFEEIKSENPADRAVASTSQGSSMSQAIATQFDTERVQKIIRTGVGIPEKIDLPPGKYEVRFAVRDNLSGLLGTISVPLELK
jgi:hypothetical protein